MSFTICRHVGGPDCAVDRGRACDSHAETEAATRLRLGILVRAAGHAAPRDDRSRGGGTGARRHFGRGCQTLDAEVTVEGLRLAVSSICFRHPHADLGVRRQPPTSALRSPYDLAPRGAAPATRP
jgi:hypothetical protein